MGHVGMYVLVQGSFSHKGSVMKNSNGSKLEDVCSRISRIVAERFGSNQTAAARSWGTAQPIVSRIMSGHRLPTLELLFAIAQTKDLNLAWLINGVGEPYAVVTEIRLPVFPELLCDHITDRSVLEPLMFRNVVPSKFSDSRYWYHATKQSCMYDGRKERLPAQYLMIETCPTFISNNLGAFRIGCILLPSDKPVFATIQPSTDGGITLEMKKSTPRSGAGGCDIFDLLEMDPSWDGWDEETKRQMKNKLPHAALSDSENTQPNLPPEAWTIHLNNTKDILGLVIAREEDNG